MNTRAECSPRIIKRIAGKEKTDDASKYDFYRQINHLCIIRLENEADKLNYSSWLTRLDSDTSDLKMHLIKILFVSLRSDRSFQIFLRPPPDDLKDLELRSDNTMDMVKWLQDNNIVDETLTNEQKKQEILHKRSAAVATNLRSYITLKTSPYFVQSFYVRSDWPIYTWYNPTDIRVPTNHDHNQWELFLNRFQIVTDDKDKKIKHKNECDDIIPIDQISKEVETIFNWHPWSILTSEENRPKRTPGSISIDVDISNQQCNQKQIDEAALAIVFCKEFPGNKIVSRRIYSDTLIPDAKFIYKMTGVTLVDYSNVKLKEVEKLPFTCELKDYKRAAKNICDVKKEKKLCPCEKPMMTLPCRKPIESTCPNEQLAKKASVVHTQSDYCNQNPKKQECKSNSKCLKRNPKREKPVEPCKFPKDDDDCPPDVADECDNETKENKVRSTVLNAGGSSSFNDSSTCDWTVSCSSDSISTRQPERARSGGNVDCASTLSDHVSRLEPEVLKSASPVHCSCSSLQRMAATPPRHSPRAAVESIQKRPREHHRGRREIGNRDMENSERTTRNGGRADEAIFGSGRRSMQRTSTPEPLIPHGQGRRVGRRPRPAKDLQNRSCPAPFAQSCRFLLSPGFAEHRPPTSQRRPDTSSAVALSACLDRRRGGLQQQQQHEPAGPSGDNRSDTAWDPDAGGSYSAFSATIRSRPPTPRILLPAIDYHSAAAAAAATNSGDNDDLSDDCDDSGEASRDWSAELLQEVDRCQSRTRVTWTNNLFDDDDNNNNNNNNNDYGDTAGSVSTSSAASYDGSVEMCREDEVLQLSATDDDRYLSGDDADDADDDDDDVVSLQREDAVSAPGSSNTWPWSSSSTGDSRSGPRVREFGDVGAPDRYDDGTSSCSSECGNASAGPDDGGFETDGDDDGACAAPQQSRRNY